MFAKLVNSNITFKPIFNTTFIRELQKKKSAIILTQDVPTLGIKGEVKEVAPGYARNYLLPKKFAVIATEENRKLVSPPDEQAIAKRELEKALESAKKRIAKMKLVIKRTLKQGDTLQPVKASELREELLKQHKMLLTIEQFIIDKPITIPGEHEVSLNIQNYKLPLKVVFEIIKVNK